MQFHLGKRLKSGACLLFLALLPLLLFLPSMIDGKIPSEQAGSGLLTARYLPFYGFLHECAAQGELPLWHPDVNFGIPFFAAWETRCLSVFSAPFYLLPPLQALPIAFFLRLIVASWCGYLACRRLGFAPLLSTFAAVSWGLNPLFVLWHGYPVADVLPFFPLLVVFMERQMLGQGRFWVSGSLLLALSAFGGDARMLGVLLAFLALVVLIRLLANRSAGVRSGWSYSGLGMALAIGLALISVQLLPYVEFLLERAPEGVADVPASSWSAVSGFVFGHSLLFGQTPFSGDPSWGRHLATFHAGLIPLMLTVLWLAVRQHALPALRRRIESWWVASLVLTFIGIPIALVLRRYGIELLYPVPYISFANAFIWALVGVAAADTWLALGPGESAAAGRRFLLYFGLAVAAAALLAAIGWHQGIYTTDGWMTFALAGSFATLFAVLIGYTLVRPRKKLAAGMLVLLATLDLWLIAMPSLPFVPRQELDAVSAEARALEAVNAPVVDASQGLGAPTPLHRDNLLPAPSGIATHRVAAFLDAAEREPLLYRRAAVGGYILGRDDMEGSYGELRVQLHLHDVLPHGTALFADEHARPQAWITYEGRAVEDFVPAELSPLRAPLLEKAVRLPKAADPPWTPAVVEQHSTTRVTVQAHLGRPGVLVLSEAWYPGWEASVDKLPAEVFPVDGAFRGVALEPGPHQVTFFYSPPTFKYGLALTLLSMLGVAVGLLYLLGANLKQAVSRR